MKSPTNRRMFLRGAGGAALAIPFLPSLMSRAFAADPALAPPGKCFVAISTYQGDIWGQNMYPADELLTAQTPYASWQVRHGPLPTAPSGGGADLVWSPVLTANASVLTPGLAQKFNVIRGADICWSIGHQRGQNLGNFDQGGGGTSHVSKWAAPTIDQCWITRRWIKITALG